MKLFQSPSGGLGETWLNSLVSSCPCLRVSCNPGTESVMGGLSFTVEWLGKKPLYDFIFPPFMPGLGVGR